MMKNKTTLEKVGFCVATLAFIASSLATIDCFTKANMGGGLLNLAFMGYDVFAMIYFGR